METLTSKNTNFVALRSDIETRFFLLVFASGLNVTYTLHGHEVRATWEELTQREASRIQAELQRYKYELHAIKNN
jgi:hypothetical protein